MTGETLPETTLRYAGARGTADVRLRRTAEDCLRQLQEGCSPVWRWLACPASVGGGDVCRLGDWTVQSKRLAAGLAGCDRTFLFAATLGAAADRMLLRQETEDMGRAVLLQAAASAFLEHYSDSCMAYLRGKAEEDGYYLRPRVSPGDGDFALEQQRPLLDRLDAARRIGVTLTDALMLLPTKTVTAVIGLTRTKEAACTGSSCAGCGKRDCPFRY